MNIYAGNLSLKLTRDELKREFMAFGEVVSVTLMNDKYIGSGQVTGYGYVEMSTITQGKAAIDNLHGKLLKAERSHWLRLSRLPEIKTDIQRAVFRSNVSTGKDSVKRKIKYSV
jgi:RNA recognition motif-containing protein